MRSRVVTTSLLLALWLVLPSSAAAQDPPPPPPPPPEAAPPPPAPPPQAREREAAPARAARPSLAGEQQSSERPGAVRRETVRDSAAAPAATATAGEQGAQRRGDVRRPPSDGPGAVSPRDHAVARTSPPPNRDHDPIYVYPDYWSYGGYYNPYYYGGVYLGYLAYSPWGWTPAFYGYPYGYAGYGGYYQAQGYDIGRVRLKVKPRDAEVFVDGYYAGTVDDFDGMLQSLRLDSGAYRIEIRKPGFETLQFDVRVQPDRTITYRSEMRPTP
jgi:PEGA domain